MCFSTGWQAFAVLILRALLVGKLALLLLLHGSHLDGHLLDLLVLLTVGLDGAGKVGETLFE